MSGLLTELEHRNLIKLTKNKKMADAYLFGIKKIEAALGQRPTAPESTAGDKKAATSLLGGSFLQVLNEAVELEDAEAEALRNDGEMKDILSTKDEEAKDARQQAVPGSGQKSASKAPAARKASNTRTRAGHTAGGRKGGRKKKAKEGEITVSTAIPVNARRPVFVAMPDRAHLQALVKKALDIAKGAGDDELPAFEEVRPWVRVQNLDVLV